MFFKIFLTIYGIFNKTAITRVYLLSITQLHIKCFTFHMTSLYMARAYILRKLYQ
jgi:hypothetical protein